MSATILDGGGGGGDPRAFYPSNDILHYTAAGEAYSYNKYNNSHAVPQCSTVNKYRQ